MTLSKSILLFIGLLVGFSASSQTLRVNLEFEPSDDNKALAVYIRPAIENSIERTVQLMPADGTATFSGDVTVSPAGIYYLYCQNNVFQTMLPVYIDPAAKVADIKASIDDYMINTSLTDPSNSALKAYNSVVAKSARNLASGLDSMTDGQIKARLSGYITAADSIIAKGDIPAPTKEFIRIWAYTSASDGASMARHLCYRAGRKLNLKNSDFLPEASTALDSPIASAFPSVAMAVSADLPEGTIEERLDALHSKYKTQSVKDAVTAMLVGEYIDKYDYTKDYEKGETRLIALTEKYNLPEKYLAAFRARRASIPGTPFPDVKLVDKDGNTVDFSTFRGKYVYIDLWASWCGPCIREIPHLQQLEKDLEADGNVVFVSISTDSSAEPWLKKMTQLNLHGNQLLDASGQLAPKLNVRGIPFFVIYDPEGRLYLYNAPRPSNEQTKTLLQNLGK
ncbi:MAG: TlpA family protein disulfide reductase [Bacteroides sp.]|nr:TlpA family protein disulfide reductase [Bacteroides sp.]